MISLDNKIIDTAKHFERTLFYHTFPNVDLFYKFSILSSEADLLQFFPLRDKLISFN